jgi:hypothetical protein
MASKRSETPVLVIYFFILFFQLPVWLMAGIIWSLGMMWLAGFHPINAIIGGVEWGAFMWLFAGNLIAIGFAWRRTATFRVRDRAAFRAALEPLCRKSRLVVLSDSPDEVILGPKCVVIRFRLQEVRLAFADNTVTLTSSALTFSTIRKQLNKTFVASNIG